MRRLPHVQAPASAPWHAADSGYVDTPSRGEGSEGWVWASRSNLLTRPENPSGWCMAHSCSQGGSITVNFSTLFPLLGRPGLRTGCASVLAIQDSSLFATNKIMAYAFMSCHNYIMNLILATDGRFPYAQVIRSTTKRKSQKEGRRKSHKESKVFTGPHQTAAPWTIPSLGRAGPAARRVDLCGPRGSDASRQDRLYKGGTIDASRRSQAAISCPTDINRSRLSATLALHH